METTIGWFKPLRPFAFLGATVALTCATVPQLVAAPQARAETTLERAHEGVSSCGGSTCHGRQARGGPNIWHDELKAWQDVGPAGAHSRAWKVLTQPRAQAIAKRLGLGPAQNARECLGCHADQTATSPPAMKFHVEDGVGCEACHGGSSDWIASHYTVGATHEDNVAHGMTRLDDPGTRARVCLNCHFSGQGAEQFITHRIMAAGHPRLSFELDLFSDRQRHYDIDKDYVGRKQAPGAVKTWAVGQAAAVDRALTLYSDDRRSQAGAFPEFYFFDCRSCHRQFSDDASERPSAMPNPGRPIPAGIPPFNDENMIVLSAAARVAAPDLARRFESDSRAFHAALASDRPSAVQAAGRLAGTARELQAALAARSFARDDAFRILDDLLSGPSLDRYTDYQGGAQAVMAVDTLLHALVAAGQLDGGREAGIRRDLNRAYQAVEDPNGYRPADFRQSMQRVAFAVRSAR